MLWLLEVIWGSAIGGVIGHYLLVPLLKVTVIHLRQWQRRQRLPATLAEFEAQHQQGLASLEAVVAAARANETDPEKLEHMAAMEAFHREMLENAHQHTRRALLEDAGAED